LFRFVRFLSPLPSDLNRIVSRIDFPKVVVQRLFSDTFFLPSFVLLRVVALRGRLIYRVVLSRVRGWVVGDVLKVSRVVFRHEFERGKYEVLGGYISPSSVLSPFGGGIIKVEGLGNVRSGQTFLAVVRVRWRP